MVPAKLHIKLVLDELHQGDPGVIQMKALIGTQLCMVAKVGGRRGRRTKACSKHQAGKSAPVKASLHRQELLTVPQLCIH